mmetsp:Transcript_19524/g.28275  ORF Transcript_19524/g.28275 Transcript_19524/m.28275 type:complete len:123 (+) Transcript_19524:115-483(+)
MMRKRKSQRSKIKLLRSSNSSSGNPRCSESDATYDEALKIAIALSLSEAEEKEPKPNINPNSRSAYALAKEEERMVKEAKEESLLEQKAPRDVLEWEGIPLNKLRSPILSTVDDSEELHELV